MKALRRLSKALPVPIELAAVGAGMPMLFALLSWTFGQWRAAALGGDYVPTAPSTACALLLLSIGLFPRGRWPSMWASRTASYCTVTGAAALGVLVLTGMLCGRTLPVEAWLAPTTACVQGIPVGRMSPLTAAAVLLSSLALALQLPPLARSWRCRQGAGVLAGGTLLMGLVVLLSYAMGIPLLYGSGAIPMALLSAISLILLGAGMLLAAGPDVWPLTLLTIRSSGAEESAYRALSCGLSAAFLGLSGAIGIAGYFHVDGQISAAREAAQITLSATAEMKVQQVLDWREERLAAASALMNEPFAIPPVRDFLAGRAGPEDRARLMRWLQSIRDHNHCCQVLLLDAQQRLRLGCRDDRPELHPIARNTVAEAARLGRPVMSEMHLSRSLGLAHFDIAVPLFGAQPLDADAAALSLSTSPRLAGVVVMEVNPGNFLSCDVQNWHAHSPTAETLLVRREGEEVVCLNQPRHRQDGPLSLRLPIHGPQSVTLVQVALGREGITDGRDYRGVPVLAAVRRVPGTSWLLVAKVDREEILAPVRGRAWMVGATVLASIVAAALGVGLLWRFRDVQWREKQRVVERRNQLILDAAAEGILGLDAEGRHVFVNPAAGRMLGYEPRELIGTHSHSIWHYQKADGSPYPAEDCPIYGAMKEKMACRGGAEVFWRKDGSSFPVDYALMPTGQQDEGVAAVLTFSDVTERQRMAEAAQRENAKLAAMIAGMDEGVVFADAGHVIVEVNEFFCRFVGKDREEILGRTIEEVHAGAIRENVLGAIDRFRREAGCSPVLLQRAIGPCEVMLRAQPIYREGRYDGVLLNVVDVTELVRSRRELEGYTEALASANRALEEFAHIAESHTQAKSEFLANMSHEIRTPMTAILGYTDVLIEENQGRPDALRHLFTIKRNGEHLLALINDVLDLSKIEAGKLAVEQVHFAPSVLLEELRSLMQVRADAQGLELRVEAATGMPRAMLGDPTRLRQVLINLLGNAIKFTEAGSVRLTANVVESPRPCLQFDVIDTGIGMTPQQAETLFRPFTQADTSTTRRFGGSGLGLSISRRLAQLLGGEVALVSSQPGAGSHFRFTVPAEVVAVPVTAPAPGAERALAPSGQGDAAPLPLQGRRILVAEDGLDNQRLIAFFLRKAGAEATMVENGQLAVDAAAAARQEGSPFHAILMDMQMPVMDGVQAVRALRQRGHDEPVIALTAHAMSEDREQCLAMGCDDYLSKPIDREAFLTAVARHANWFATFTQQGPIPCNA